MKNFIAASIVLAGSTFAQTPSPSPAGTGKRPFTFEDMMALKRLSEPVPSPDGKWVVFAAVEVDLKENTKKSHLWIVPASGGESRRLNQTPNEEERPRFSPDGKRLIWTSKATDPTQIWMCDFDLGSGTLAGNPHQVTNISTGAEGGIWSPDGKNIVFISKVYPDAKSDEENKKRDEELKESKAKAQIFTRLFYRHWSTYTEFKRSHLFIIGADADATTAARDLTPGDHDVPPFNLGGQDMYAISPDVQELAYTSNIDEVEATSTNNEIFIVPMSGGTPKKISTSPGSDSTPLYSPDGKYIAWRSQARGGFEADKWRLFVQDRQSGKIEDLTVDIDSSVESFAWSSDSTQIAFTAEWYDSAKIFWVSLSSEPPLRSIIGGSSRAGDLVAQNGKLYYSKTSVSAPAEICAFLSDKVNVKTGQGSDVVQVTHMNDVIYRRLTCSHWSRFGLKIAVRGPILPGRSIQLASPFRDS
jgi:Tol biopolymer transport system component